MLVTVDTRGRITIPKPVLRKANWKAGDKVDFRRTASGGILMLKVDKKADAKIQKQTVPILRTSCT